jgi:hypothetical protein
VQIYVRRVSVFKLRTSGHMPGPVELIPKLDMLVLTPEKATWQRRGSETRQGCVEMGDDPVFRAVAASPRAQTPDLRGAGLR